MAAGIDWVEISAPVSLVFDANLLVRFHPDKHEHPVEGAWRAIDRVGLIYVSGGSPVDFFAGRAGLFDYRTAFMKRGQEDK